MGFADWFCDFCGSIHAQVAALFARFPSADFDLRVQCPEVVLASMNTSLASWASPWQACRSLSRRWAGLTALQALHGVDDIAGRHG